MREVAYALAYWSSEYQSLGKLGNTTDNTLQEILTKISPIAKNHSFKPGIIVDRMEEITQLEKYQNFVLQPTHINLDQLAQLAITAYLSTSNFTLLHGVTSCHALRVIFPWISDKELALRYFWQAFVVAYLSTGSLSLENKISETQRDNDWNKILSLGCTASDDHDIKLIYSCWSEYHHYGNQEYLMAASQVAGISL